MVMVAMVFSVTTMIVLVAMTVPPMLILTMVVTMTTMMATMVRLSTTSMMIIIVTTSITPKAIPPMLETMLVVLQGIAETMVMVTILEITTISPTMWMVLMSLWTVMMMTWTAWIWLNLANYTTTITHDNNHHLHHLLVSQFLSASQ